MKHKVVTGSKTIANHISRIGKLGVDCIESAAKNTLSNFKNAFDGTSEAEEEASINRPYPLTSTDNTGTTGYHREYLPSDPHAFQWRSFIVVCAILMLTCLLMFCVYLFIDYRRRKSSSFSRASDLELGYQRYESCFILGVLILHFSTRRNPLAEPPVYVATTAPRLTPSTVTDKPRYNSEEPPAYDSIEISRGALQ
jgi:hypothetical protein